MASDRSGPPGSVGGARGSTALTDAHPTVLATRGLTKRYGDIAAVDRLELGVERGIVYGFLGPNGAGKTTTIRMLLGLIHPSGGTVEVLGQRVFGDRKGRDVLRRVGAIVEEPAFWNYLSGRRNLEYLARAGARKQDRDARLRRVDDVLRLVGLEAAARKRVKAYSQGMRQRLGIAAALLGAPEVLVLDEPTNGLDPQGMREVRALLRRLAEEGTTVFVSSHLLFEVDAMCDRVGVLARGRLVAEAPPSELRSARERIRVEVDDRERALEVARSMQGVTIEEAVAQDGDRGPVRLRLSRPASSGAVNRALVAAGIEVSALVPERESLEDVFVSLVEGQDVPR